MGGRQLPLYRYSERTGVVGSSELRGRASASSAGRMARPLAFQQNGLADATGWLRCITLKRPGSVGQEWTGKLNGRHGCGPGGRVVGPPAVPVRAAGCCRHSKPVEAPQKRSGAEYSTETTRGGFDKGCLEDWENAVVVRRSAVWSCGNGQPWHRYRCSMETGDERLKQRPGGQGRQGGTATAGRDGRRRHPLLPPVHSKGGHQCQTPCP